MVGTKLKPFEMNNKAGDRTRPLFVAPANSRLMKDLLTQDLKS